MSVRCRSCPGWGCRPPGLRRCEYEWTPVTVGERDDPVGYVATGLRAVDELTPDS